MYIEKLTGTFLEARPGSIILDVNGVGYGLEMPLSTLCELPTIGSQLSLWIYTYVREDAIRLFGFLRSADRICFDVLLSLNGIGPKIALAILSTMPVTMIRQAILSGQSASFEGVPGIGPRLAEKILVELKPKLKKLLPLETSSLLLNQVKDVEGAVSQQGANLQYVEDVRSALENLGYKDKAIILVMNKLLGTNAPENFTELMRAALLELRTPLSASVSSAEAQKDVDLF